MKFSEREYLDCFTNADGETIFHLKKPCSFIIKEQVISALKENYNPNEEIGGVLWFKPTKVNDNFVFVATKVTFIENVIENHPELGRSKRNSYLPDKQQHKNTLQSVFEEEYLPIHFHTHPVKGENFAHTFSNFSRQRETSIQDQKVSNRPFSFDGQKILMPRGLVLGNSYGSEIFIGLYNGKIAPISFEETKSQVMQDNIEKSVDSLKDIKLSDETKLLLGIGLVILLILIIGYRKQSLPVIAGLMSLVPIMLSKTNNSNYFNQLSKGDATINIPE